MVHGFSYSTSDIPIDIEQDATLHNFIISGNCSTCFAWYLRPSSTMWRIGRATVVCAPDDGWKYHPKHVKQFPDINNLCKVASYWIYEYIGILLGARPILHISRIKIKSTTTTTIIITRK
jgi:hypothetical protein